MMKELCDAGTEALMTLKLRLKNKANKIFRQAMRRFEPEFFYEKNGFSPESKEANRWRILWVREKLCLIMALLALYLAVWWLMPIMFFALVMSCWERYELIDISENPEYDHLHHAMRTDNEKAIKKGCAIYVLALVCLFWFAGAIG